MAAGPGVGGLCEETGEENPERHIGREQGSHLLRTYTTFRKKRCENVLASFDRHLHDRIETSVLRFPDESVL